MAEEQKFLYEPFELVTNSRRRLQAFSVLSGSCRFGVLFVLLLYTCQKQLEAGGLGQLQSSEISQQVEMQLPSGFDPDRHGQTDPDLSSASPSSGL